jgi:pimeloyl-ACP methyl ester carboxylesterase
MTRVRPTASGAFALAAIDRTPLFYELDRPPCGGRVHVPAFLLDGIGCDGYVWKYLRPALAGARPVVHPHYRGHGRSPPPVDPARVGIADLADDIAAVMDDAGIASAILAGHSMGVQVALEVVRRHPDRVRALILMCGAPENPLRTFKRSSALEVALPAVRRAVARAPRLANQVARLLLPTQLAYAVAARLEINRDLVGMADFMPYLRGLSHVELPYFLSMLAAAGEHSARDLLPTLRIPTLVIAGARDGFTPPELSREMAAAIPDAELVEIEDGSHTAPLERPEQVADAVLDFLARRVIDS